MWMKSSVDRFNAARRINAGRQKSRTTQGFISNIRKSRDNKWLPTIFIFREQELGAKFTLKEYCWIRPGSQLASPELDR
jgi:hypothetical protein